MKVFFNRLIQFLALPVLLETFFIGFLVAMPYAVFSVKNILAYTVLGLMFVSYLVNGKNWKKPNRRVYRFCIYLLVYFLTCVLSMFFGHGGLDNYKELIFRLPFLLFPLFLLVYPRMSNKAMTNVFYYASVSMAFALAMIILRGLYVYVKWREVLYYYMDFRKLSSIHSTYFGFLLSVLAVWNLHAYLFSDSKRKMHIFFVLLFGLALCFNASRMSVLIFIIGSSMQLSMKAKQKFNLNHFKLLLIAGLLIIIGGVGFMSLPSFKHRNLDSEKISADLGENQSLGSYKLHWTSALSIAKSPFIGKGIGTYKKELVASYKEHGFYPGVVNKYNVHNQYIEDYLSIGGIGLLMLVITLLETCIGLFKEQDWFYCFLVVAIGLSFLTESMLMRTDGVLMVGSFLGLAISRLKSVE